MDDIVQTILIGLCAFIAAGIAVAMLILSKGLVIPALAAFWLIGKVVMRFLP